MISGVNAAATNPNWFQLLCQSLAIPNNAVFFINQPAMQPQPNESAVRLKLLLNNSEPSDRIPSGGKRNLSQLLNDSETNSSKRMCSGGDENLLNNLDTK